MIKAPKSAGAPKTRLRFIENKHDPKLLAPVGQLLDVFQRSEVRPDTLVGFHQHARDMRRCQSRLRSALRGPAHSGPTPCENPTSPHHIGCVSNPNSAMALRKPSNPVFTCQYPSGKGTLMI